jgi:hypothetical protein
MKSRVTWPETLVALISANLQDSNKGSGMHGILFFSYYHSTLLKEKRTGVEMHIPRVLSAYLHASVA